MSEAELGFRITSDPTAAPSFVTEAGGLLWWRGLSPPANPDGWYRRP
jgi:hypothetical protein